MEANFIYYYHEKKYSDDGLEVIGEKVEEWLLAVPPKFYDLFLATMKTRSQLAMVLDNHEATFLIIEGEDLSLIN